MRLKNGWWCICVCSIHNFSLSSICENRANLHRFNRNEIDQILFRRKKTHSLISFYLKKSSQLFPYITLYPIPSMEISGYRSVIVQSRGILQMWHNLEFAIGKDFSSKACESMAVKGNS